MIGYLKGKIIDQDRQKLIIDVNGTGYEVFCPTKTLQNISPNEEAELFVYTHVREDQLKLFGFESKLKKELFEMIINVNGVGPKIGLLILSAGKVEEIRKAISKADLNFFTQIKGLGKKGAQKIIIELKNKIGSVAELDLNKDLENASNDVIDALVQFGFNKNDIKNVLVKIDENLGDGEKIKKALQMLGK